MKKILFTIVCALCAFFVVDTAQAQNLAGTEITTTMGVDDGASCKTRVGTQQGGRIFRDGVSAACPSKACPGGFASANNAWDEFSFQNIVGSDVCITIDVQGGACQATFNTHGHVQTAPYVPPTGGGDFCGNNPSFLGDQGGSGTNSFSVEVPGCTEFFLVFTNASGTITNCEYSFTIQPDPLLDLRCGTDQVACIEKVTIGGTPVPTMTQWGLFLFGLIVLTLGVVTIYNMSTSRAAERR